MNNTDLFNAANALSTLAISARYGEEMVKSALDGASIGAAGGAAGGGLAAAGLGGLLAGIGQPDETEEDKAKLKNRRMLAALGLGIPGAAVGGYLGSQQAPHVDAMLAKLKESAIVQYFKRLMAGKEAPEGPGTMDLEGMDSTLAGMDSTLAGMDSTLAGMGLPLQAAPEALAGAPRDVTLPNKVNATGSPSKRLVMGADGVAELPDWMDRSNAPVDAGGAAKPELNPFGNGAQNGEFVTTVKTPQQLRNLAANGKK